MSIAENVARVRDRIAAASRAGRNPEEIALMAVTKTHPPERIREAYAAGLRLIGENRVQEFATKADALRSLEAAEWHMVGHLQSNKAASAAELFTAIDSVDSLQLAEKLNASAQKLSRKLAVLIEINVGGEAAKSGVAPGSRELEAILQAAPLLTSVPSVVIRFLWSPSTTPHPALPSPSKFILALRGTPSPARLAMRSSSHSPLLQSKAAPMRPASNFSQNF